VILSLEANLSTVILIILLSTAAFSSVAVIVTITVFLFTKDFILVTTFSFILNSVLIIIITIAASLLIIIIVFLIFLLTSFLPVGPRRGVVNKIYFFSFVILNINSLILFSLLSLPLKRSLLIKNLFKSRFFPLIILST